MEKLKFKVLNLIAIILLTIFLTSCEKQAIQNSSTKQITEPPELSIIEIEAIKNGSIKIFLPEEIALDGDKIAEYLHTLSAEKLYQHILTHKIIHFLGTTNNFERFYKDNPNYTFLTMDDLHKYAPNNIEEFKDFDPYNSNNITLRGCSTLANSCYGSTLIEADRCCSEFLGIRWDCKYEIDYTYNSSECTDPCSNVACGWNQYCSNGWCYDNPSCPKCKGDEVCIGATCTPL